MFPVLILFPKRRTPFYTHLGCRREMMVGWGSNHVQRVRGEEGS